MRDLTAVTQRVDHYTAGSPGRLLPGPGVTYDTTGVGRTTAQIKVSFDHTQYNEALKTAARTGRPLVIKIGASWCGPCKVIGTATLNFNTLGID